VIILAATVLVLSTVLVILYNGLVRARQRVREGWSAIDVQLKRRSSLIPNLVETVEGYAAYERGTMQRIAEARGALGAAVGRSSPGAAARADAELTGALQRFSAVAEAYPDLKANERFAQLQRDLADTENKIAYARNYYNGAVELFNIRVQSFPGLLLARTLGFRPAEFFAAEETEEVRN
jgi:LemA protein